MCCCLWGKEVGRGGGGRRRQKKPVRMVRRPWQMAGMARRRRIDVLDDAMGWGGAAPLKEMTSGSGWAPWWASRFGCAAGGAEADKYDTVGGVMEEGKLGGGRVAGRRRTPAARVRERACVSQRDAGLWRAGRMRACVAPCREKIRWGKNREGKIPVGKKR